MGHLRFYQQKALAQFFTQQFNEQNPLTSLLQLKVSLKDYDCLADISAYPIDSKDEELDKSAEYERPIFLDKADCYEPQSPPLT